MRKKLLLVDQTAHFRYQGRDNYGEPKFLYLAKLWWKSDKDLLAATEQMIWLSAYASNNPRSDYHWQADACYDEWVRRDKADQYTVAFEAAKLSAGVT